MAKAKQELTTLRFAGSRFDDGGLEIDVLPELIAYKGILVDTAKELWRRSHPDRERLPKRFEESIAVKFYRIEKGSTAIPLLRELPEGQLPNLIEDEFDEAAALIEASIEAASADRPLPENFPKSVIPLFGNLGKTLAPDESFFAKARKRQYEVQYTHKVRERLATWLEQTYEDIVDLIGEVWLADVYGCNFMLRLDDGRKVPGKFEPSQELLITEALHEHTTRRLRVKGRAEFSYQDGSLRKITRVDEIRLKAVGEVEFDASARPIWEMAVELGASVPKEEWAKVPKDLSKNLDHYLYGAPKEGE
jgi:hypothetical protein